VLLQFLFPVLRRLPPEAAARMVSRIGRAEYALVPGLRSKFERAVTRAQSHFQADWEPARVAAELAGNQVRWRTRDLLLDGRPDAEVERLFRVQGEEHLRTAHARKKGVILLGNHFGAHLMPAHWVVRRGYPLRLFMERPHHVSRLLAREFDTEGPLGQKDLFISRGSDPAESARSIFRAARILKAGYLVFIAGDVRWQDKHTVPLEFLGRPCRISTTWVALAALSGAPVVPTFCRMDPDGSHDLAFLPAIQIPPETASDGQSCAWVADFLSEIERRVRIDPANSNEYLFWADRDDPAYAKQRLIDPPHPHATARRVAS
jgi:KDO2-lipid IV(A) lauroyltransferase